MTTSQSTISRGLNLRSTHQRLIFPLVNGLALGVLCWLVGRIFGDMILWTAAGFITGFGLAFGIDMVLYRLLPDSWWYRRRVLFLGILEIFLMLYGLAPYLFVLSTVEANNHSICCKTPADFGTEYVSVQIPVEDGIQLAGWFIPASNPDRPTIIVAHGSGGDRLGSMWHAERLHQADYNVLVYDQRALGESTGDSRSGGWLDWHDISYLIDYLVEAHGVNPEKMGGVGLSLGANILLTAAPDEPRLTAIWADGAGGQRAADLPPANDALGYFDLSINYAVDFWMVRRFGEGAPRLTHQIAQLEDRAVMLIAGEADQYEVRMNQLMFDHAPSNVQLWIIPDTGHVGGPGTIPSEYTRRMIEFFEAAFANKES